MTDVEDLVRDTLDHYARHTEVSSDALERMAAKRHRRRVLVRAGGFVAAAAAVIALVVAGVVIQRPTNAVIEPATDGAGQATATEPATNDDPTGAEASGWEGLSVDQAVDRLIAANRDAPDRPVPDDGQVLVDRTYAIWSGAIPSPDYEQMDHTLILYAIDAERRTDGTQQRRKIELADRQPTDDPDELRAWAQQLIDSTDVDARLSATHPTEIEEPDMTAQRALQEAEADSRGSADPTVIEAGPSAIGTERPDQLHAFIRAADALREGLEPGDRIRALEAIGRIDDRFVEYRGPMVDLLGREGVGIASLDNGRWSVLIFDTGTGELLGEYDHAADNQGDPAGPAIDTYTALKTSTEPAR